MKNASLWVGETILSIQNQTIESWELIVVDDYSTDDSCEIVQVIALNDHRIKLLKNDSNGIISALKMALNHASGTFITRMDADDIMPSSRLELQSKALQSNPPKTIVTGKACYFAAKEISEGYLKYEKWLNDRVDQADFYDHIYRECIVASPNWMGRTADFRKDQLFENLIYPEDYDLCFHWQNKGYTIKGIDEITLQWREHPNRTSRNSDNYQQPAFFRLKMLWFSKNHPNIQSLGIVGMGQKGKLCLEYLVENPFTIHLFDMNHTHFTQPIAGKTVKSIEQIDTEIVLIARYPNDIRAVQQFIETKGYKLGETAFWV